MSQGAQTSLKAAVVHVISVGNMFWSKKKIVVAITLGPHLWLSAFVCVCMRIMCICLLHPFKEKPTTAAPTTEGAQMCCWLQAEAIPAFRSDSSHKACGSNSKN